jgi:hypothetical protein
MTKNILQFILLLHNRRKRTIRFSAHGIKLTLLSIILIVLGLVISIKVDAQVSTLTSWTNLYDNTANLSGGAVTMPTGSGSYRMLIVAVASSQTATGNARIATVTYGTQTLRN